MQPAAKFLKKKVSALTLIEMLVVLVIVGILTFLALPIFLPMITKAKSTEAKIQLAHVYQLEKSYYFEHSKFSQNLTEIGFSQETLSTDNAKKGTANYLIVITSASPTGFTAKATSVVDFNSNGTFNVWQIDQNNVLTEVTPD